VARSCGTCATETSQALGGMPEPSHDVSPQAHSESTPLLPSRGSSYISFASPKPVSSRKARLILLSLVPFVHLGVTIAATTILDVFRDAICRLWHSRHDEIPPLPGVELDCTPPGVSSGFSALMTTLSIIEGVGGASESIA
jgi:hypothetical protein